MESFWEGYDKFVWTLVTYTDSDACLLQTTGAHQGDKLIHEIRLLFEELWGSCLHRRLELVVVFARNAIPCFSTTDVMIIHAMTSDSAWFQGDSLLKRHTCMCCDPPCAKQRLRKSYRHRPTAMASAHQ